jgi:hypothetical protein
MPTYTQLSATSGKLSAPLDSALAAVHAEIEGMSDDQMDWHPEGKWSTAEILEHLGLTYSRTAERMKQLPAQGSPRMRRRSLNDWRAVFVVLKLGRLPMGRKSPEVQVPRGMSPAEARTYVAQALEKLDEAIDQCERRFGSNTRILVHFALGPLSASDYRRFHYVHTTHHMKQVGALRDGMKMAGIG